MKKSITIIGIMFLFVCSLSSQNRCFVGEKSYLCSKEVAFKYPGRQGNKLTIKFLKEKDVGMIALTIDASTNMYKITGKILIYLENGTVIACIDRNKYDFANREATTIYHLTKN